MVDSIEDTLAIVDVTTLLTWVVAVTVKVRVEVIVLCRLTMTPMCSSLCAMTSKSACASTVTIGACAADTACVGEDCMSAPLPAS